MKLVLEDSHVKFDGIFVRNGCFRTWLYVKIGRRLSQNARLARNARFHVAGRSRLRFVEYLRVYESLRV